MAELLRAPRQLAGMSWLRRGVAVGLLALSTVAVSAAAAQAAAPAVAAGATTSAVSATPVTLVAPGLGTPRLLTPTVVTGLWLPTATIPPAPAPSPSPSPSPSTTTSGNVSVSVDPSLGKPSQTVSIILLLTVLSVAPALLVLCTSFTKIIVVLSLTRNALGTTTIPPNQVLAGLALFLSLFIMSPVLSQMNDAGVQPYLKGQVTQSQAFDAGVKPLRQFMMKQTRPAELATMVKLSDQAAPATPDDVKLTTLIPAFVLSELKSAFIIGFVVFIPFLVIDVVVSSVLMSMGMMMLPPALISLPFKLLLFVMVDGWSLIATALVQSYH
ncbi:flagellar type III secretion system pore protein FliP [Pedococcus sp. KACC 23699]|uniref:Flagellar biosynthetic protein FliP n=1 Tax=Pedococcus sp. KACC 23699 TaxID=3149228 RepID=A0AAU7JZ25_9MICO